LFLLILLRVAVVLVALVVATTLPWPSLLIEPTATEWRHVIAACGPALSAGSLTDPAARLQPPDRAGLDRRERRRTG